MTKKITLSLLTMIALIIKLNAQSIFVNRVYQNASGSPVFNPILNPFGVQWSKSVRSSAGGLIMVGYTSVSGQGQNIYLVKRNVNGDTLFKRNYNTAGANNDYGLGVYEATNGDIYVCGSTDNGGTTNYNVVLLRYNTSGTLLNSSIHNGAASGNDAAVSIIKDASNNIFVAANTADANGLSNMWLLKLSSTLSLIGSVTYDYVGFNDFALGLSIVGNNINLIGPSASGTNSADYVQLTYNRTTLASVSQIRNNLPGTALDQAYDFCKDVNDNTYITGKSWNGTNYDIKTIRMNANFTMSWTATYNAYNLEDAGTTIITDNSGNIIVGGFVTKSNNLKDLICLKYNGATGALIWQHKQTSKNPTGDAAIKQVCVNPANNDIYYVAVERGSSGLNQVLTSKLNVNGVVRWQRNIINSTGNVLPSDVKYATDGIFVISVLDSLTNSYLTTKYNELELDTARSYSGGKPVFQKRELIVSFLPTAIKKSMINKTDFEYGAMSEFLTPAANTTFTNAFKTSCPNCDVKVVKIYNTLKTTDTIAKSRLNQNIKIPSFWSTLLLQFPSSISIQQAKTTLNSLKTVVSYAHPDYFLIPNSVPNDSLYPRQASLHSVNPNPNAHINVEEAWDVVTGCGASFVKGGVFDTGVRWDHRDFGYVASNGGINPLNFGKVKGWNFPYQNSPLPDMDITVNPNTNDPSGHGTAVAGIIGAARNNISGIAGIAGGNVANNNSGVSLYSINAAVTTLFWTLKALFATSGGDLSKPYSYKLNFSNHSYSFPQNSIAADSLAAYSEQVRFANRMQVTFVTSRGNTGTNNVQHPACFDPNWVISVGASGLNGSWANFSSFGSGVDLVAPGDTALIRTTENNGYYRNFNGTSAAAPHAAGVVGLLMSYLNDSSANYKNLAPEDCEFILQRSATDVGPVGYDSLNGYGRLNAGKALRLVENPVRLLYHYGTNGITPYTISKTVYSNVDTIRLTEKYENYSFPKVTFQKGKYIVKTWQINATVNHSATQPTDSLMYYWPRHSSSYVYALPTPQKKLDMHEKVSIVSCNGSSASLRGYIYQVKDSLGNQIGWWPCDTSFSALYTGLNAPKTLMEYSILTKNKAVGIYEKTSQSHSINIYPNPTNHKQTIVIESKKAVDCNIKLYDVMGRFIKTIYSEPIDAGNSHVTANLDGLPSGMYFYLIKLDDVSLSKKFIKE